MLSMCSLVCRLVRGWKQSEATSLISQAATTPGSSLLLQDLSEPELNVEIGSYAGSPYPHLDIFLQQPYNYGQPGTHGSGSRSKKVSSAFCQSFVWSGDGNEYSGPQRMSNGGYPSLFCRRGCGGEGEGPDGGGCGRFFYGSQRPRTQVLWCDNNRQASLVTPRQTVDLSRWTLFFSSEDEPMECSINVPTMSARGNNVTVVNDEASNGTTTSANRAVTVDSASTSNIKNNSCASMTPIITPSISRTSSENKDNSAVLLPLKRPSVQHNFGMRARTGSSSSAGSSGDNFEGYDAATEAAARILHHPAKITVLLEARYKAARHREQDEVKNPIMVDQVCQAYAWKCRGVFGVIAHTTALQLMIMVEAFFGNNLMLDNDLHVTKILTVDCIGEAGRMTEPSSLPESFTPGGYYHETARQHQHSTLLDAARCLSSTSTTPESSNTPDSGGSTTSLHNQRSSSPFTRGMPLSSSFSSSPYRRPHSAAATPTTPHAVNQKAPLYTSAGNPPGDDDVKHQPPSCYPEEDGHTSLPTYLSDNTDECSATAATPGEELNEQQDTPDAESVGVCDESSAVSALEAEKRLYDSRPPNVLVYTANSEQYFTAVRDTLNSCFERDRYAVYHLTTETAFRSPWPGSATLLVICGNVQAHINEVFIRYLLGGGRVLSICSDFLNMAVPLFGTVELAEQPVVGVKYGRWGSAQFLHHEHCSHTSSPNNRFSTNLETTDLSAIDAAQQSPAHTKISSKKKSRRRRSSSNSSVTSPPGTVSVEPTHIEITDTDGVCHPLQLTVLAKDDTWGAPSIIGAKVERGLGRAVFSQVHLEHGPDSPLPPGVTLSKDALQKSADARRNILRDLLSSQLLMHTDTEACPEQDLGDATNESEHRSDDAVDNKNTSRAVEYTAGVLLGDQKFKTELLTRLKPKLLSGRILHRPQMELVFLSPNDSDVPAAAHDVLPVVTHSSSEHHSTATFDERFYYEHLKSTRLGRVVLHCPVLSSSQAVIEGTTPLLHGFTVVVDTQTNGVGRGGNIWLSPAGCTMFSFQLHLPLSSFLGSHLPLVQHVVCLAVVEALSQHKDGLQLSIKWPNDILAGSYHKVGGILTTATSAGDTACINVGMGVNVSNPAPTVSLQGLLTDHCRNKGINSVPEIKREELIANIFNELERLIDNVEQQGPEHFLQLYYQVWRHSDAQVKVVQADDKRSKPVCRSVTITGIDYYGFLKGVDCETGEPVSVHPDGNSFNMMEGLVYTKVK